METHEMRFYVGASKEARDAECARFNALSQDNAKAILEEMDGQQQSMRSCWYCNSAHEHLKNVGHPILCLWGCGITYIKGFPAVIVGMRAHGKEITDEKMQEFEKALKEGQL